MKHLGTKPLETARLLLRPFVIEDAAAMFHNWAGDDEVTRYLTWPTHREKAVSERVTAEWVASYDKPDFYQWAIVFKELGEPVGSLSVVHGDDRIGMVHIGYCIGRRWWHQGITSEALAEVIRFFFEEVGVNRIESRHDPRNPHSGAVMVKCGMVRDGVKRQADWNNQGVCDVW
ncbi:MAG: GNAT family N-acetyltransferase, partial [Clostridia bacterium]|nr:GNAT family N-acetyltransferase [Clostridia bacterium]